MGDEGQNDPPAPPPTRSPQQADRDALTGSITERKGVHLLKPVKRPDGFVPPSAAVGGPAKIVNETPASPPAGPAEPPASGSD